MKFYGGLVFDKKWPYTFVTSVGKNEDLTIFVSIFKIDSSIAPVLFGASSSGFLYWNHQFLLYLLHTNEILWRFNF